MELNKLTVTCTESLSKHMRKHDTMASHTSSEIGLMQSNV